MTASLCYAPLAPNTPVLYKPHPRSKPIPARVVHATECGRYLVIDVDCYWKFREVKVARHMLEPFDPNDPSQTQNLEEAKSQSSALNTS